MWVSASIDGSRLKIQIKENEDTFQEVQKEEKPCDLIAEQDGVITKMVTRSGVPMVHVGDQVKKGDILDVYKRQKQSNRLQWNWQICSKNA